MSANNTRELRTKRLLLRKWRLTDREAFAKMNADPHVMEYIPTVSSAEESAAAMERIEAQFALRGYGLWAVEIPGEAEFVGFIGLSYCLLNIPVAPCVEVRWRLAAEYWGKGYATEGATAALQFGFDDLGLSEIVSLTAAENGRSRRVMEKLGMTHSVSDDFDHPNIPEGHRLRRHVLYRICSTEFKR